MRFTSLDFEDNDVMPKIFHCHRLGGLNCSPHLEWSSVRGAKSYFLICYDPDAPSGKIIIHWIIPYIHPNITSIPCMDPIPKANVVFSKNTHIRQSYNTHGQYGWMGPCPPNPATHRYVFGIYALDAVVKNEADTHEMFQMIANYTIDRATLIGLV